MNSYSLLFLRARLLNILMYARYAQTCVFFLLTKLFSSGNSQSLSWNGMYGSRSGLTFRKPLSLVTFMWRPRTRGWLVDRRTRRPRRQSLSAAPVDADTCARKVLHLTRKSTCLILFVFNLCPRHIPLKRTLSSTGR